MVGRAENILGHWESEVICAFNDRLLERIGSAWNDWLPISLAWQDMPRYQPDVNSAVKVLQQEFENSSLFVFKDPRLCRLARFWTEAVRRYDAEPYFVIPIRNPVEVAQSLEQRSKLNSTYGQLLWLRHVLDAEQETRNERRFFLSYSALLQDWKPVFSRMQENLGLQFPNHFEAIAHDVSDFLRVDLRHNINDDDAFMGDFNVVIWVRRVYQIMLKWSEQGENSEDYKELDTIFRSFNESSSLLVKISSLALSQDNPDKDQELDSNHSAEINSERELIAAQESSLQALHAQVKNGEARQKELVERLLAERAELMRNFDTERESLTEKIGELAARSAEVESNLVQRREEIEQALAEARREEDLRRQAEQALVDKEVEFEVERDRADRLAGKLTEADGWVFKLAGDRREAELELARLQRKLKHLDKENNSLLARLETPRIDLSLLARAETAELGLAQLKEEIVGVTAMHLEAERQLNDRSSEIAQITLMLGESEAAGGASAQHFLWLQSVQQIVSREPRFARFRSQQFVKNWRYRELQRQGLFDADAYIEMNPDVAAEGMDPLQHFILHGLMEGRSNGIKI